MKTAILSVGTEILMGQIVNTNTVYLSRELNALGFDVMYHHTVGDNTARLMETMQLLYHDCDLIITTGGLGPTQDDLTKETVCEYMEDELVLDEASMAALEKAFEQYGHKMTENNLRQAMIPEGAHIFVNHAGTAPGVAMERDGKLLVNLPGPPSEMKDMFQRSLAPYLVEKYGISSIIYSRVLHTYGIGESMLETKIDDLILAQKNPTLALLVRPTGVIIRITAKTESETAAEALIAPVENEIRARLGSLVYGADDEKMEEIVGRELKTRGLTVATAESCTGGLVASRLTDVAGSSEYVKGGIVSYTDEVKAKLLGVPREILAEHGAVSEPTARAMAEGARRVLGADIAVSTTGLAGPGGGTENTPVGTVFIAAAGADGTVAEKHSFTGTRGQIKFRASQAALALLRKYIKE